MQKQEIGHQNTGTLEHRRLKNKKFENKIIGYTALEHRTWSTKIQNIKTYTTRIQSTREQ